MGLYAIYAFIIAAGVQLHDMAPEGLIGPPLDQACAHYYAKGWNNMSTNDQIGYVVLCKPRGWA